MGEPEKMHEMEQVSSHLKSLKTVYGLLHRDPTDETLDETSRAFMTKMLDDITRQTLLRQAKEIHFRTIWSFHLDIMLSPGLERKLSIQSDHRRTRGDAVPVAVPVVKPIASFSPSLHACERSSRLRTHGAARRRDGRHGQDDRLLARGASPVAVRVGAEGSSTRRLERLDSGLSTSMVSRRGTPRAARGAATPKLSSSTDAAATTRSRIRPKRDLTESSLRRAGEADEDESPRRRRGKGKEKADNDAASVSMGRPSRPPRRALNWINSGSTYSSSSSSYPPEPTSSTSGSTSSWLPPRDKAPSWVPPPPPPPPQRRGNAPSWVPPPPQPRGIAPPEYVFQVSGASRISRHLRRQERLERRVERMRRFKEKLGTVFNHLHHHHFGPSGSNKGAPPLFSRDVHGNGHHRPSPWKVLAGVLHRATRRGEKKTRNVPADRRGGGIGHALLHMWDKRRAMAKQRGDGGVRRALFQMWGKRRAAAKRRGGGVGLALFQMWVKRRATAKRSGGAHTLFHMWGKRRATAGAGMWGTGSRLKAKKLHWWQRVRPRRRSGHGKALR
uniref:Uncharacterized protein n=1 Tax=Oryza glumipatula TaxID=40148 RepID=A0A0E0BS35_9ORYZ